MARSVRRQPVLLFVVALVALVSFAGAGCSGRSETSPTSNAATPSSSAADWRAQAQQLLAQYDLQPTGGMQQTQQGTLRSGEMSFELVASASRSVGLDLDAHAGERARWYSVPLKTDDPYGPRSAIFVVWGGELIGAAGSMNADPGIVGLDFLSTH